ncbi:MAG: tRNA guanosine(34) transglycosylase Tgt [Oscillospiraceae bacterium]|nr:tRNA guanosine(34) transglycosylase Tgt [Oscillospiraceae bacterium]
MLTIQKTDPASRARLSVFATPHGEVRLPAFMNVATAGAIRGGLSACDLKELGCQVMLSNTYHLHLRPGDEKIRALGGLRKFTGWEGPLLTDSGGFQVFSLAPLRKIREEGVYFASHIDGRRIFMGPEESVRIQSNLASTVAMAFDECVQNPNTYDYVKQSVDRTVRWLIRCKSEMERLSRIESTLNPAQMLFGINQGGTYPDLRTDCMKRIAELDLPGYSIGGLAVGETAEEMYHIIEQVEPHMPKDKPRYLMGVGTPLNILESVRRGVDLFDCVMPSRNARHGHAFTSEGVRNMKNQKYQTDDLPVDPGCLCPACRNHSRAYIHHLIKAGEMLAHRLLVTHNLWYYNHLMEDIRAALDSGRFDELYRDLAPVAATRI